MENEIAKGLNKHNGLGTNSELSKITLVTQRYFGTSMARLCSRDGTPLDMENENAKTV